MNDDPYKAISCASHDEYEVAIMHKTPLSLRWREENGETSEMTLMPLDLRTEHGNGEFLIARDKEGTEHRIRLDRILNPPRSGE